PGRVLDLPPLPLVLDHETEHGVIALANRPGGPRPSHRFIIEYGRPGCHRIGRSGCRGKGELPRPPRPRAPAWGRTGAKLRFASGSEGKVVDGKRSFPPVRPGTEFRDEGVTTGVKEGGGRQNARPSWTARPSRLRSPERRPSLPMLLAS